MTYPTKTESAEYRMVTGSARSVSDEITELFNEGWELHGSAFSVGISVCQPVVKKKRVSLWLCGGKYFIRKSTYLQ